MRNLECEPCATWSRPGGIRLRTVQQRESGLLRDLYARLSDEARYGRFFSAAPELPESVVQTLIGADDRRHLTLAAEVDQGSRHVAIGLGNLVAIDETTAEVGLVVCDEWQRRGIGTALATAVMRAADGRGYGQLVAHVRHGNVPVRRILDRFAVVVSATPRGGICELVLASRDAVPSGRPVSSR